MAKFTVRVPEQFIDFEFKLYENEKLTDKLVIEDLDDKAWDAYYQSHDTKIEVYDEHGFQVAIPSGEPKEGSANVKA